jgi:hypothetical protein
MIEDLVRSGDTRVTTSSWIISVGPCADCDVECSMNGLPDSGQASNSLSSSWKLWDVFDDR